MAFYSIRTIRRCCYVQIDILRYIVGMLLQHKEHQAHVFIKWRVWLDEHVKAENWWWHDANGLLFINFEYEEDATLFKLTFSDI